MNSTSLGAVPDFGPGIKNDDNSRNDRNSSSSSSIHCYDVMEESLDILNEMNNVVDNQENINTLSSNAYLSPYIIMYNMTEISVIAAQRVNVSLLG